LLLALVFATSAAHGQAADAVVAITPASNVDESVLPARVPESFWLIW
jgi:hypothetical protein